MQSWCKLRAAKQNCTRHENTPCSIVTSSHRETPRCPLNFPDGGRLIKQIPFSIFCSPEVQPSALSRCLYSLARQFPRPTDPKLVSSTKVKVIHPVDCTKSMGSCSSLVRPMYFSQAWNILTEEYSFFSYSYNFQNSTETGCTSSSSMSSR